MRKVGEITTFRAFKSTDYTLYLTGRAVSQFGVCMQQTAVVWLVYTLTNSNLMVGVAAFAELFPQFLLSPLGGVAADRYRRYRVVYIAQIASMIQATLLAVLILTHHCVVWEILTLSALLGIINAFDIPARQAMIHDVVQDEGDLPSALSLSAATASLARLVGPALSGLIMVRFGAGICFLINAISFVGVIVAIAFMKQPKNITPHHPSERVLRGFAEGISYIRRTPAIGLVISMVAVIGFFVMPFTTLLPDFAKVVFEGNAQTFGYITSCIGVGSIAGTILLASLKKGVSFRRVLMLFGIVLGIALICFSQIKVFPIAMIVAGFIGFGAVAQFTSSNIIVQSESSPEMRGRVISITIMAMHGAAPLGSLIVGAVSQQFGVSLTLLSQGVVGLCVVSLFYVLMIRRQHVH